MNDLIPSAAQALAPVETASTAIAAQAKALVEARYTVAMHRPRDWDQVRDRLLKDCRRPGFADSAIYHKPVGKGVTGPSIRFAEAAIRNMTNVVVETMTTYDDHEKRIVRVTVTDLEANVPYSQDVTITKTVERNSVKQGDNVLRSRTGSKGQPVYILEATDDDILNKANALISKAIRTLGLRLLPGDIMDECMEMCRETQRNRDAQDPDTARRRIFDAFSASGVSPEQIKEYLGHDAKTLAPREIEELRALYNALRDGETTWREAMDAKHPKPEAAPAAPAPAAPRPGASRASQLAADLGAKPTTTATTEGTQP